MSLRARLSWAFVLLALVPLTAAALLVTLAVPHQQRDQARARAEGGAAAAVEALRSTCTSTALAAEQVASRADTAVSLTEAARTVVAAGSAASVLVVDGDAPGRLLAGVTTQVDAARASCADQLAGDVLLGKSRLADGRTVLAVVPVDRTLVTRLGRIAGTDVTIAAVGRPAVSTLARPDAAGRQRIEVALTPDRSVVLTASRAVPSAVPLVLILVVVMVLAVGIALALATQLARLVTRPLTELGSAARRVAGGDLVAMIPVAPGGQDEVAVLGRAFNDMTGELRSHISELERSRDELRGTLTRLGETLSSTHDLDRILAVILETAQTAIRARAGALFLHSGGRGDLYLAAASNLDRPVEQPVAPDTMPPEALPPLRVGVGEGVVGRVFASGEALRGAVGFEPGQLRTIPEEPSAGQMVAVPLRSSGRVTGVLALYDRQDGRPFDEADLDTIRTFASQAGVAIDNVLLHQEAQRLSITDGLTGLWNYRYLTMALNREVERSVRFQRPLAVLMLDLDRFKAVNDVYGHQRGDSVLIEVATRVKREIREVDVLARYGGEELVCMLPETDVEGAVVIAERIHRAIRSEGFASDHDGTTLHVTISVGVAVHPHHGQSAAQLLRSADEALYEAKREGRDCVRVAGRPQPRPPLRLAERSEETGTA